MEYPKADVHGTILMLRKGATRAGLMEAAVAYGWSAIRLGNEILADLHKSLSDDQH